MGSQLTAGRTISKVTKEEDLGTRELLENLRDALLMKKREEEKREGEARKEEEREEAEAREGEKEEEEKHLLVRVNKVGQRIEKDFGKRKQDKRQGGPPDGMPSHAQMKEQRKQIEALINSVKGTPMENDPLMKAQLVEMEKALQMFDLMGIHKKREEEKRQGGPPDGMPSHAQMKEQRKQIEALINSVKGTPMENDPLMKAQL